MFGGYSLACYVAWLERGGRVESIIESVAHHHGHHHHCNFFVYLESLFLKKIYSTVNTMIIFSSASTPLHYYLLVVYSLLSFCASVATASSIITPSVEDIMIKHVLIPIVMEAEAKPFVDHLGLDPIDGFFPSHTPFLAFSGEHHNTKVTVITFGKDTVYGTGVDNVGTVSSSLATFLAVSKLQESENNKVDLILNAGTCGGFQRMGAAIGDVFLTTGVANHDRRIPIPGFDTYGIGKLTTLNPTNMASALGFKTGICTTGNSLDKVEKDDEIMKQNEASVKDMEAAAIAWVATMNQIPYLGVKVVTDIVDGDIPTQEEFLANLSSAAQSLQSNLPKALEYVCDKTEQEL